MRGERVTPVRPITLDEPTPLTETEQYLLDTGFSARAAREFCEFDLEAVREACAQALSTLDTKTERDRKIGKLVQRWRRVGVSIGRDTPVSSGRDIPEQTGGAAPLADEVLVTDTDEPGDEPTFVSPATSDAAAGPPVDLGDLAAVWAWALGTCQMSMARHEFDSYLRDTVLLSLRDGVAIVGCSSAYQQEQIERHLVEQVQRALADVVGKSVRIVLRLKGCE
jgi:hypothetical protein